MAMNRQKTGFTLMAIAACLIGIVVLSVQWAGNWYWVRRGMTDFPQFYLSPHLLGTGHLYDQAAFVAEQARVLGHVNFNIQFIRFPFVAVLASPLSHLPYMVAYLLWEALSVSALVIFARLWPVRRPLAFVVLCWFPPVAATIANGQDVSFAVMWVAVAAWLVRNGKQVEGGLALALCLAKPHLCLFLPVLIVATRMWKLGAGLLAGWTFLLAVSFLVAGPAWPLEWIHTISTPLTNVDIAQSSLLASIAQSLHGASFRIVAALLILAAGVIVYKVARRSTFEIGLGAALAAGPVMAYHVYVQDYLLALPLVLTLVGKFVVNDESGPPVSHQACSASPVQP